MLPVRWRLTLWFSLLLGLTMAAAGLLIYVVLNHRLIGEVDDKLQLLANQVHRDLNIPQQKDLDLLSIAPSRLAPSSSEFAAPGLYVQILDGQGAVVATSPNLRGEQLPIRPSMVWDGLQGRAQVATLVTAGGEEVRVRTVPMIHGDSVLGLIQVGQSLHHVNLALKSLGLLLAAGIVAVWTLTTVVRWILAGRALRPVSAMTETAAFIAATADDCGEGGDPGRQIEAFLGRSSQDSLPILRDQIVHDLVFRPPGSHLLLDESPHFGCLGHLTDRQGLHAVRGAH